MLRALFLMLHLSQVVLCTGDFVDFWGYNYFSMVGSGFIPAGRFFRLAIANHSLDPILTIHPKWYLNVIPDITDAASVYPACPAWLPSVGNTKSHSYSNEKPRDLLSCHLS